MFVLKEITEKEWERYGFKQYAIHYDAMKTGYKAIFKNDRFIAILSEKYKLLPNEVVEEAADMVASSLGAEKNRESGVVKNRFYGLYDLKKPIEPIKGVTGSLGYYVYNSIDGSLGYGVSVMTIMTSKYGRPWVAMLWAKKASRVLSPEATAAMIKKIHRGESIHREKTKLVEEIKSLISRAEEAIGVYRLWSEIMVEPGDPIEKNIVSRIPSSILLRTGYFTALKHGVTLMHAVSCWDLFTEIGYGIWYGTTKSGRRYALDRRHELYRALLRALPVEAEE